MLRKLVSTRRRKVAAVIAVGILVATGAGLAAWLLTLNDVPANSKLGTLNVVAMSPTGYPAKALYPGSTGDVVVKLNNTGDGALKITQFGANSQPPKVTNVTDPSGSDCTAQMIQSHITWIAGNPNLTVPVGVNELTLPNALSADSTLPNECQGATFSLDPTQGLFLTISTP